MINNNEAIMSYFKNKKNTIRVFTLLVFALLSCLISGCESEYDSGSSNYCDRSLRIAGSVHDTYLDSMDYSMQSIWFARSSQDLKFNDNDKDRFNDLGLNFDSPEDRNRYQYLVRAYNHRVALVEDNYNYHESANYLSIKKDFSAYFFDLEKHDVQPGQAVNIIDFSPIRALRNNKEKLGKTMRTLIDEMRTNDQPDVVIGFAPDRTQDSPLQIILVNLFSPNTYFAKIGQAKFYDPMDYYGDRISRFVYPERAMNTLSLKVKAQFDDSEVLVDVKCLKVKLSDETFVF